MSEGTEVLNAATRAEEVVTGEVSEVAQRLSDIIQGEAAYRILDATLFEWGAVSCIMIFLYILIFHDVFQKIFFRKENSDTKKNNSFLGHVIIFVVSIVFLYTFTRLHLPGETLIRFVAVLLLWMIVKYGSIILDKYYVAWSSKKFGERALAHNMVKVIIKRILVVIALFFTFIFLKIGIVRFFSLDIPAYFSAFVLIPLFVRMNLFSFFSVINKGFRIGDFIQVGNDAEAISGTCVDVKFNGVKIIMLNGQKVIMKLERFARADVINLSTRYSHRIEREYLFDARSTSQDLAGFEKSIREIIDSTDHCKIVQCVFSHVQYHHTLRLVFDVKIKALDEAQVIANDVHCAITEKCRTGFATSDFMYLERANALKNT